MKEGVRLLSCVLFLGQMGSSSPLSLAVPRARPMFFDLVFFFLLVFSPGVFLHKEKILGLWPHSPGIRSRQVNKTKHFTENVSTSVHP